MSLVNQYVQNPNQLGAFFERIRQAQAPTKFTQQFLKDIGFTSSNFRAYLPLLKALGFLSEDGSPKSEYMLLLDPTQWKAAIARAIRDHYSDIFVMKTKPTKADRPAIIGKYKTTYNMNDLAAERAANTFLGLLDLADEDVLDGSAQSSAPPKPSAEKQSVPDTPPEPVSTTSIRPPIDLCYNIQIHLPPTKDVEVYNAIFRALREHLIS